MEEKEIKLEILELKSAEEIVLGLEKTFNLKFDKKENIEDIYFDTSELKYFNLNHAIRLRKKGDKSILAYKALFHVPQRKENPWFIFEKECELPVENNSLNELLILAGLDKLEQETITLDNLEAQFRFLNLSPKVVINKIRYIAQKGKIIFCVDVIEDLGIFIEIEGDSYEEIKKMAGMIPYVNQPLREGYTNLYTKRILGEDIPDFDSKFKENSEWNLLPNQKENCFKDLF